MREDRPSVAQLATLVAVLATGSVGALVTLAHRNADPQLIAEQRNPPPLKPPDVEHVVKSAPDPSTGKGSGESATCRRGAPTAFGNPWTCTIRYKSGRRVQMTVKVLVDGTYQGRYSGGGGATGCCIDLPGTR